MKMNLNTIIVWTLLFIVVIVVYTGCMNSADVLAIKGRVISYASVGKDYAKRYEFFSPAYFEEMKSKGAGWEIDKWQKAQWDATYSQMTKVHQKLMEPGVTLIEKDITVQTNGKFAQVEVGNKFPEFKGYPIFMVKDGEQWYLLCNTPKEKEKYGTQ